MAAMLFTKAILEGGPIDVYNHGDMHRDFTYIDDIVEGVVRVLDKIPAPEANFDPMNPDPAFSNAPYRLFNIGTHQPVGLMAFIETLERTLGKKAITNLLPMQAGDVPTTFADTHRLQALIDFAPHTPLAEGMARFVEWYREHFGTPV